MNSASTVLLTQDTRLESLLAEAGRGRAANLHVARNADEALRIVCEHGREFDVAIIDFADGCHGMTLLSALHVCQPQLRIITILSGDVYHAAAFAYANGVTACLAKPFSAPDLALVLEELNAPKLQLACAA